MFDEFYQIIDYKFKNIKLLEEALTHPSTAKKRKNGTKFNYQKLELLGDSILSSIIAEYLFKNFEYESEGELSKKKAYLVSNSVLAKIAKKKLNLNKFMILGVGEENSGGREKNGNLEDLMESVIGAIFLDSDFENVRKIVLNLWRDVFNEKIPKSSKMELQEWTQEHLKKLPIYNTIQNGGTDDEPIFLCKIKIDNYAETVGEGYSKKEAENNAAEIMINNIKNS